MITVEGLTKVFRVPKKAPGLKGSLASLFRRKREDVRAVDGLTFRIEPGERVGFLGPNGAGKTTTLKMLSGLLNPSAGHCEVLGARPFARDRDFLRRITLVMGQKQQLLWDLPPQETFELNRALYDLPRNEWRQTLDELIELLDLKALIDRPTRTLSLGERMKCELAAALLHRPSVLFLDEPTIGLDVTMQFAVRRFIAEYNTRTGATILLTSHYMEDVQALCPRVLIIDKGTLRYDGDLGALVRRTLPDKKVIVRLDPAVPAAEALAALAPVSVEDGRATFKVDPANLNTTIARILRELPVTDLTVEDPPLEEVIAQVFKDQAAAPASAVTSAKAP